VVHQGGLLLREPQFRAHVGSELRKWSRGHLVREAGRLARGVDLAHFRTWGRPGIRAQLVERHSGKLAPDFVVEESGASLHVLNAVSPAFTCALPFGEHLVDRLDALSPA
jgi:(S)-2-hydroxyglutarate dehydrogenase